MSDEIVIPETDRNFSLKLEVWRDGSLDIEQDEQDVWIDMAQAAALWPLLKRFAETGQIGEQP